MGPGDFFKSKDKAAIDFGKTYNGVSILENKEYGSTIYVVKEGKKTYYTYTEPARGSETRVKGSEAPEGTTPVAMIHTHGKCRDTGSEEPVDDGFSIGVEGTNSTGDIDVYNENNITGYVAVPNGELLRYDPEKPDQVTLVSSEMPSDPNDPSRVNDISPYTSPPGQDPNVDNGNPTNSGKVDPTNSTRKIPDTP